MASLAVPERPWPADPAPIFAVGPHACRCPERTQAAAEPAYGCNNLAPAASSNGQVNHDGFPTRADGLPDFSRMDIAHLLAYHRQRLGPGL